ncbi:MAG: tRNA lysidine(34) synthetase TilS [Jatrophihabitantaceae bacterium]
MGPHPAVAEVRRAVRTTLVALRAIEQSPPPTGGPPAEARPGDPSRVLVACSGGADSLALAAAVAFEAPRAGLRYGLVTVDHGLQAGSDVQAARVAAIAHELGFDPVRAIRVDVGTDGGPEGAARDARYDALAAAADAWNAPVLLGHTRDDQAETVLLGLGRGSGPRSIAGMRPLTWTGTGATQPPGGRGSSAVQGCWLRPLLGVRRATTEAACAALGLDVWQDPQNLDPAFRRVRLRREVLPLLEEVLGGGVVEALARTASLLQDDLDALDAIAAAVLTGDQQSLVVDSRPQPSVDQGVLDVSAVAGLPRAIRTRVIRNWAADHGARSLTSDHTAAVDALITDWHGQGPVDLPGGRRASRASGKLTMTPMTPMTPEHLE